MNTQVTMPNGNPSDGISAGAGNTNDAGLFARFAKWMAGSETSSQGQPESFSQDSEQAKKEPTAEDYLNKHKELFTPPPDAKKESNKKEEAANPFAFKREDLQRVASSMDFLADAPAELINKAREGDFDAMLSLIKFTGQRSFAEGLGAANHLMDKRLTHVMDNDFKSLVDNKLKDTQLNSSLASNPILNHPATQPIKQAILGSLKEANPNLTPSDLESKVNAYLTDFAKAVETKNKEKRSSESMPGSKQRVNPFDDALDF